MKKLPTVATNKGGTLMFANTYYRLKTANALKIGFLGGSVTYGFGSTNPEQKSWRALITEWLRAQYPNADITTRDASVGGTGSEYGAYRVVEDLKLQDEAQRPELIFVEFAINDMYDRADSKTYMESIVRTIYQYAPEADILMAFTTDIGQKDQDYSAIVAHKQVAEFYGIPYVYLGARLYRDIVAEKGGEIPASADDSVWKTYFTDIVHPADAGYAKYAAYMREFLSETLLANTIVPTELTKVTLPMETLAEKLPQAPHSAGFAGQQFANENITVHPDGHITATQAGTTFTFEFVGTELKIWVLGTKDSGMLNVSVDGELVKILETARVPANHRLMAVAENLPFGKHKVTVELVASVDDGSCMDIRRIFIGGAGMEGITVIKN